MYIWIEQFDGSLMGDWTLVSCMTDRDTNHYAIEDHVQTVYLLVLALSAHQLSTHHLQK